MYTIPRAWVVDPNPLPGSNKLKEMYMEGLLKQVSEV